MSKEIAQTVGGKRIAWLLAILAAFAVMATLGSQWRGTTAAPALAPAPPTQSPVTASFAQGSTQSVIFTGTATLDTALNAAGSYVRVNVPAGYTITATVCTPVGDGDTSTSAGATSGQCNLGGTSVGGGASTVAVTATVPTATLGAVAGATTTVSTDGTITATSSASAGYTIVGVGSITVAPTLVGGAASISYTLPIGVTYCSDGTGGDARSGGAVGGDVTISGNDGAFVPVNTPTTAIDTATGVHTITNLVDDGTPGVTVTISVHASGLGVGVGCVTVGAANNVTFVSAELRHMSDTVIAPAAPFFGVLGKREVAINVRNSRHTVCTVAANTGIDLDNDGVLDAGDVAPAAIALPGLTLANIVITNGGGYASTVDTDPTFSDVRIFIGDGNSTGIPGATTTAGLFGATCISWVSLDAGDQSISLVYVGAVDGLNYSVHWDTDGDNNDNDGTLNDGVPNTTLIKEWNRLEDSQLFINGVSQGTAQNVTRNIGVTLNPSTGLYQFTDVNITDIFRGSHTNSAGGKEGPGVVALDPNSDQFANGLAGVNWTVSLAAGSCGAIASAAPGGVLTYVTTLGQTGLAASYPNITFSAGGAGVNCGPGRSATINFTGSEPGPLGSGTGIVVTESVTITFTTEIAAKQVFLAWAGQRIILEHDWRIPAGDKFGTAANGPISIGDATVGTADQTDNCPFSGTFSVTYIRGSGPGNFLPSLGAAISGNDQAIVSVQDDDSQSFVTDADVPGSANGSCISRVLYESEDQGQVDIEAFVSSGNNNLNVTKHAFVIYYMKINTINVSLATQFSKPTHNSSAIPDWSNTGGTGGPTNPWDASKDDADNATEWNVSKDLLVRGRVTGWFVNSNPSGRARDDSNPLNVLPADRWVLPNDWALLAGGPADAADGSAAIGTAEQFRPYYDIIFGPNQTSTVMTASPDGVAYQSATTVVASATNTATSFRVASCSQFSGVAAGTALLVGASTGVTFTSCVFSAAAGTSTLTVAGLSAAPAAGTAVAILAGVPFEGPYSLLDIPGLAVQGKGGAALSNLTGFVGGIRDTIRADGDVNMWDAPMPPAPVSVSIRGTGFIKQVLKQDVYYLGAPSGTNSTAAQAFNNPFYIANIPDSPFIPAIVVGGGYFWDSWGSDGPGGLGQGVYRFWTPAIIGTNSAGVSDSFTQAQTDELNYIRTAYGDNTIARDLVVYTDNHGEFMVAANGDYRTVLTGCATNVLALGAHCVRGDKVGTGTITATADYPDFRGKHFPVLSNAATVDWTWGGYKDVTVEKGETDQFKYIVFHAMDRDGFCSPLTTGAVLLHPVLSGAANDAWLTNPAETVDFLIDSGEGIILGTNGATGLVNDGKQFATGVTTFSWAVNNPAVTGVKEFDFSPLAAEGAIDECQAWIKVSNSLLGVLNVLTIAHDDEGNIGFDRVIDLTNTHSYSLSFRWSLITWIGADAISVNDAIKGTGDAGKNPGGNDISASVTAIYGWDAAAQQWLGFFPSGVNVPGANDLTSLKTGDAYWIAITGPSSVTWTIASNVN